MLQMSFSLTTEACRARTKNVTRRLTWAKLKPGDRLQQIEKGQGLKKGQHVKKIHVIEIVSNRPERLDAILDYPDPAAELAREGLPHLSPKEFVDLFWKKGRTPPHTTINRIEFRYLP